jgi:isopentenyl phosphate kinase
MSTVFVKWGGSLITDKRLPETPRMDVIRRLAREVAAARAARPDLQLVLGHGSGSFGHVHGRQYGTRDGATTPQEWLGFAMTGDAAARLNRIVVAALLEAGVPAWAIQPSVALRCENGAIVAGPEETVQLALARTLQPVVFGDVALDAQRGATIASTEEIFQWLAPRLQPALVVLLGEVEGIYTADPLRKPDAALIPILTRGTLAEFVAGLGESYGVDVTGGMAAKVRESLAMIEQSPGLEVVICSGLVAGNLEHVLSATAQPGTRIRA